MKKEMKWTEEERVGKLSVVFMGETRTKQCK
jgi:hypothetical protein